MSIRCPLCHTRNRIRYPINLDAAHFDRAGASDLPLVFDFWTTWCGPCRAMAPVFENAAREFGPRLRLAKIDTDAEPDLAARYRIQVIPTTILMRGGESSRATAE